MGYSIKDHICLNETSICTFRIVNGSILTAIGIIGFFLSVTVIYVLIFRVIRLPGNKNIFMLNVALFDALLAVVGTIRGLGIISKSVMGVNDDYTVRPFCNVFTLVAAPLWDSLTVCLLPLTVDRFIAILFATKYRRWITLRSSIAMVVGSWLPLIALNIHDVVQYKTGKLKMMYQHAYHRCSYENHSEIQPLIFLVLPFLAISTMYILMIGVIIKNKIRASKLILTTSAIIFTSLMSSFPFILMVTFNVEMNYEVAQVMTVTFYYINGICNPIIYLCSNPRVQSQLERSALGETVHNARCSISGVVTNTLASFKRTTGTEF